jgi:hypothetical protein
LSAVGEEDKIVLVNVQFELMFGCHGSEVIGAKRPGIHGAKQPGIHGTERHYP